MKDFGKGHLLPHQMLLKMKLIIFILTITLSQAYARAQDQVVTLSGQNMPLKQVFKAIEKQTGYAFFYSNNLLNESHPVTLHVSKTPLKDVLKLCFEGQPLSYDIQNTTIFVAAKATTHPVVTHDTTTPKQPLEVFQGKVLGEDGEPLPGVTISLKGTEYAWTTKPDGAFVGVILPNSPGMGKTPILVFSFVGRQTKEVALGKIKNLIVTLRPSVSALDEVQFTAYSKTSKRYNVGDITTVKSEEIARNPVTNVLEALQGRVAGMYVSQNTGVTNGSFRTQIRSANTLTGTGGNGTSLSAGTGGQPLYIVDGVEYPASNALPMTNGVQAGAQPQLFGNALNFLDPALIESVTVLKGADATAIYGSRGAFGVILIITKKAKAGKPMASANVYQGFSEVGTSPRLMNIHQYLALRRNAFANDSTSPAPTDLDVNGTWDTTKNTDWHKYFLGGHAPVTKANVSFSGGGANSSFLVGAFYSTTGNVQLTKGNVRAGGANFSLSANTNDHKFTLALSGSYQNNMDNRVLVDFSGSNSVNQAPDAPNFYLPNGKLDWSTGSNPLSVLNTLYNNTTNNLLANTTLTYTPIRGLSFIAEGGVSYLFAKEFSAAPSAVFNPATFNGSQTAALIHNYNIRIFSADPRIQFNRIFWNKLNVEAIAGGSIRDAQTTNITISGSGYLNDELLLNPASAKAANINSNYSVTPTRYLGAFTTFKLRWADKYILELNGRRDGSSVFGPSRQYGNFGSIGGGWIISEEPWFKPFRHVVDFLKIKGSYALEGASGISAYQYLSTYTVSSNSYMGGIGLTPSNLANPYLHWETDKNAEVGVNFDLFNGIANIEAIYYTTRVGDQLTTQPLSGITGFNSFVLNSNAQIRTTGYEFTVITHNLKQRNFSWETSLNLTIPRSKLLAYPGIDNLTSNINYIIGKPITGVKLYQFAGVDPATGYYNYYNFKGVKSRFTPFLDPQQLNTTTDRKAFVDLAPKWYGGILNTFSYKNFSLDFLVSITSKMGPNYMGWQTTYPGQVNTNFPKDLADKRWMKPGDNTDVPRASANGLAFLDQLNYQVSTGAFSNATFARLQNLSFSWRLPTGLTQRAHLNSLRVYVAGQNLLTISKYGNLDPENLSPKNLPPLRTFTGGIMVSL